MSEGLREQDIRPKELFETYQKLVRDDIKTFFMTHKGLEVRCETCDGVGNLTFTKDDFSYRECEVCGNLWMSPRPPASDYELYYRDAPSSHYWSDVFSPAVEADRLTKLWRPKAVKIRDLLEQLSFAPDHVIDIGGGTGLFAEAYRDIGQAPVVVVEPNPKSASQCLKKNIPIIEKFVEQVEVQDLPPGRKLLTAFELFEHVLSPRGWLKGVRGLMDSGDLLLVTTLNGQGLDLRVLWEKSRAIFPPIHINFMNPTSLSNLGRDVGLVPLRALTPGLLDIDILRNQKGDVRDRFWASFLASSTDKQRDQWQNLIASSGFSSHMWVLFEAVEMEAT